MIHILILFFDLFLIEFNIRKQFFEFFLFVSFRFFRGIGLSYICKKIIVIF
jgi:hypothetical protein